MAIPKRTYQDDVRLSLVAMGGIVVCNMAQSAADELVAEAIERGVNYFDVAPTYFNGEAEAKLGHALRGRRDDIFLACKTNKRDAEAARADMAASMERLETDRFDLYQFHGLGSMDDVEKILGPGGAMEAVVEAQRAGRIGYVGFSAHDMGAGMAMLARSPVRIASALFPLNVVCVGQGGGFGMDLLAEAKAKGAARLALKAMAFQVWPEGADRSGRKTWYQPIDETHMASLAFRWTLDQDITAAVPPGEEALFRVAMDTAEDYQPLSDAEREELQTAVAGAAPIFSADAAATG